MAKGGKEIRRRIRSVTSTQQITKAMKMVAAARLRKGESRTQASQPYTDTLREVMRRLGGVAGEVDHPFLRHIAPHEPKVLALLMTSDKGLCGTFNAHLFHRAEQFIADEKAQGHSVSFILAGRKGQLWAKGLGLDVAAQFPAFNDKTTYADLAGVTKLMTEAYLAAGVSEVHLIYARYVNIVKNIPTVMRLLPIEALPEEDEPAEGYRTEYLLEPNPAELLHSLLPSYFRTVLFQAALENFTSENGARMVAMENATSAASDMIDDLTLQYNKARQAGITLELLDIVGGAEALQG